MTASQPEPGPLLPAPFFARPAPVVARDLLGMQLASTIGGALTGGVIVETEAYLGTDDPGSHAATRGITARNRVLYGKPGHTYVYFAYGNHHMLNLVAEPEGVAGAVLVRAVEPLWGLETMAGRRGGRTGRELTNGPGKLASALGITLIHNDRPLGGELTVREGAPVPDSRVGVSGRIGLSAGEELPLRFFIAGNPFVSRGRVASLQEGGLSPHPRPSC